MAIEPDPCIPLVLRSNGRAPDRLRHVLVRRASGELLGAQVELWHDSFSLCSGRYVYPVPEYRMDGIRIMKG